MQVIEQENQQSQQSTLSSLGKLRISDNDSFFDDYSSFSMSYDRMYRNSPSSTSSGYASAKADLLAEASNNSARGTDSWVIVDDPPEKPKPSFSSYGRCKPSMWIMVVT